MTAASGQKVVQGTEAPRARAASEVAAASTQLTRLRAKLRPGPGTVGGSWPLCSRRVPHKLCRASSGVWGGGGFADPPLPAFRL